ncbi:MAG: YggS family pyridoxal phosphate-dependent enzyme [Methylotetracoccus sp.]
MVLARIRAAEIRAGREPGSVTLIAVSKTFPATAVAEAHRAGLRHFGESYAQEALSKRAEFDAPDIVWHFIGPIQSNKTRPIAAHFDWVHGIDRLRIASRLSEQRPVEMPPLNACIQVNISGEASKSGVSLADLPTLAAEIVGLARLRLRGLMAIPAPGLDDDEQRRAFRKVRDALLSLRESGLDGLDTLSMGMSDDLEAAVGEGATMVRIGTAIFGSRAR